MGVKSGYMKGNFNTLKTVILRKNLIFVKLSFTLCCENGKCGLYLYHNQKQNLREQKLVLQTHDRKIQHHLKQTLLPNRERAHDILSRVSSLDKNPSL
jgi:hypothetical protein